MTAMNFHLLTSEPTITTPLPRPSAHTLPELPEPQTPPDASVQGMLTTRDQPLNHEPANIEPPSGAILVNRFRRDMPDAYEEVAIHHLPSRTDTKSVVQYYRDAALAKGFTPLNGLQDDPSAAQLFRAGGRERLTVRVGPAKHGSGLHATVMLRYAIPSQQSTPSTPRSASP